VRHCRCFFQREFWPWSVLPYPTVFADIGFTPAEAAELIAKSSLIIAIKDTIARRKLTQQEAARLCGTDQPTLSKVFRGRMESVTGSSPRVSTVSAPAIILEPRARCPLAASRSINGSARKSVCPVRADRRQRMARPRSSSLNCESSARSRPRRQSRHRGSPSCRRVRRRWHRPERVEQGAEPVIFELNCQSGWSNGVGRFVSPSGFIVGRFATSGQCCASVDGVPSSPIATMIRSHVSAQASPLRRNASIVSRAFSGGVVAVLPDDARRG
jgi:predicted XRE-type DNA-binding protein